MDWVELKVFLHKINLNELYNDRDNEIIIIIIIIIIISEGDLR